MTKFLCNLVYQYFCQRAKIKYFFNSTFKEEKVDEMLPLLNKSNISILLKPMQTPINTVDEWKLNFKMVSFFGCMPTYITFFFRC